MLSYIEKLKIELREQQAPFFSDDELEYYYQKNNQSLENTLYELFIIKSEDSTLQISGLTTQDTSAYFKRLASKYKTFNSGILK